MIDNFTKHYPIREFKEFREYRVKQSHITLPPP